MASAGALCTVMVDNQRLYIKIETVHGQNLAEIHIALCEVCGKQAVDHSTISHWFSHFHEGHVTINNDPRPGRPKTSTDTQSVKRVVDFLAEDRRMMCEEISLGTGISLTLVFHIL
jgi:hypothetical protein